MKYTEEMKVTGNSSHISCKVWVEADGITCHEFNATEGDKKLPHATCDVSIPANAKINLPIRIDGVHFGGRIDLYIDGTLVNAHSLPHSPTSSKQKAALNSGFSTITEGHQTRLLECDLVAELGKSKAVINDSAKTESDELDGAMKESFNQATLGTLHMRVYLFRDETKVTHISNPESPREKDDDQGRIELVPRETSLALNMAGRKRNLMNAKDAPGKALWCDFTWKYTITPAVENPKAAEGTKSKRHPRKKNSEAIDSARATPQSDISAVPSAPATPAGKFNTDGGQDIATESEVDVKNEDLDLAQNEGHDSASITASNKNSSSAKIDDQAVDTDPTVTSNRDTDPSQADNQVATNASVKDSGAVQPDKHKLTSSEMPPPKRTRLDAREEESVRAKAQAEQQLMEKQKRLASAKARQEKRNADQLRRIEANWVNCRELEKQGADVDKELEELEVRIIDNCE